MSVNAIRSAVAAVLVAATGLLACDRDEKSQSPIAQVLTAIVRDAAGDLPPDEDPDALPVVYVISGTDEALPATAQAAVANALNGEIDVRFADTRDEALDDSEPGVPVRDGGALVAVGNLRDYFEDENVHRVDIAIEVYRTETQFSLRTLTFAASRDVWSVTSTSVTEELDVPPTTEPPDDPDAEDGADDSDAEDGDGDEPPGA